MNDDQLRQELERRSQAATFRAEELLPEVRRWTEGGFARPARFARWAPLAGLAAAAVIALVVIIAVPRFEALPGTSLIPTASSQADVPSSSVMVCADLSTDSGSQLSISDETGLVASCDHQFAAITARPGLVASGTMVTANWMNSACWSVVSATFASTSGSYSLAIHSESPPQPVNAPSCAGPSFPMSLTLHLSSALDGPVTATANGDALAAAPAPSDSQMEGYVSPDEAATLIRECGQGNVVAYFRLPPGWTYKTVLPKMGLSPELNGLDQPFFVIYSGPFAPTPTILGQIPLPGQTRPPLSDGLCVFSQNGELNLYSGVSREGMTLPPGAHLGPPDVPIATPSQLSPAALGCGSMDSSPPVTLTDHSGLVIDCAAHYEAVAPVTLDAD